MSGEANGLATKVAAVHASPLEWRTADICRAER
jgi:hypothetical protein